MSTETIALIASTLTALLAAIKAIAEARKAKYEAAARAAEAAAREEAEKTTDAVIKGVERAKRTLGEANLAQFLVDEIKSVATDDGVEEGLNKRVKAVKKTGRLDRDKLKEML